MILLKFILFHYGALLIAGKFSFDQSLRKFAIKTKTKFFYNLVECSFCYHHFVGVLCLPMFILIAVLAWGVWGFELLQFLVFPFMSASAFFITKTNIEQ